MDSKNIAPNNLNNMPNQRSEEVDLFKILYTVLERKNLVLLITLVMTLLGVFYSIVATPHYQAQSLLQVEQKESGLFGLSDMSQMFLPEAEAVTEIELLKSRMVLGEAVDRLKLDIIAEPSFFPLVGRYYYRKHNQDVRLADTLVNGYAWGGESISVVKFDVPNGLLGKLFYIEATGGQSFNILSSGDVIASGKVGEELEFLGATLFINHLNANQGVRFKLSRLHPLEAINILSNQLIVSERGKNTGILDVKLTGTNPTRIKEVLDTVTQVYVFNNVSRNSAEASNSLEFLQSQLPEVQKQLVEAETRLNEYQVSAESVNILSETESILEQVVAIESKISDLQLQEVEVKRRFRPDHPNYVSLIAQMGELEARKGNLQRQIKSLPETQQRLLRLERDVKVSTEIYTQMLNNIQELDIVRAGTIGNVRVVDSAAVDTTKIVKPNKLVIIIVSFISGLTIAVTIVLALAQLKRGIENPEELEQLGLSVYAAIPFSTSQEKIETKLGRKYKQKPNNKQDAILSLTNATDISVEAIKSLRTSVHFAMVESKNNVLMITGPTPAVGKSFVSSNLAVTMAQAGKKVLLIDADMRKGYVHKQFAGISKLGLSEYLIGDCDLTEAISHTSVDNLDILAHGVMPPNPSELLMSAKFQELIEKVAIDYDLVIIDTPPILAVTDASIVGKYVGTTMMVVRYGLNPVKEVEIALKRLEQNGIDSKGIVFNGIKRTGGFGYQYGYGYGYGYYTYEYNNKN